VHFVVTKLANWFTYYDMSLMYVTSCVGVKAVWHCRHEQWIGIHFVHHTSCPWCHTAW